MICRKWFNCQGELEIFENPISCSSIRPIEFQHENDSTKYSKPILNISECHEVLVIKENILQVTMKNIKFHHHPLFSLEHVLERQLRKNVDLYEKYMSNYTLKKIYNRLEATRHVLENAEKTSSDDKWDKINKYKKDIKETRESLFIQGKEERQLLKSILALWKNMKTLRTKNGYTATPVKLIINKESQSLEADKKLYEENLQKAYHEVLREYRDEFKKKMKIYKRTLQDIESTPRSETDATIGDSPKKPIYNVDEDDVFKLLKSRFEESFRRPGEPFIRFKVTDSIPVTSEVENSEEMLRRHLVASTKLYLKIICNNLTVCKTKAITLNNSFDCHFDEKISILLTNIPKFIRIFIVEQTNVLHKNSSIEVNIPVSSQSITKTNVKNAQEEFEKFDSLNYKHEGIGCGISLKKLLEDANIDYPMKLEDINLHTSGSIYYQSYWEKSGHFENREHNDIDDILNAIVDKNGKIQLDKLAEWIDQTKPDPRNPKNSALYEYIQGFGDSLTALKRNDYFR